MKKTLKLLFVSLLSFSLVSCTNTESSADNIAATSTNAEGLELSYPLVDTGVVTFYSNDEIIQAPSEEDDFYGQDATYHGNVPSYIDNSDDTITDNVTGLMWQQDMGSKMTYEDAASEAETSTLGGYDDWRLPSIKELYSLIQFTGDGGGETAGDNRYIDTDYFIQPLGDTSIGEREIDAQTWSKTIYVGETMNGDKTVFGVNFIDGRIKGYPYYKKGADNTAYFRLVRGSEEYGKNNYIDNEDGTITDLATGLMWQQGDSEEGLDWQNSLKYAENLELANYNDWRLPNAKELQSIVDYTRSPSTTDSAAIDPLFSASTIEDMDGQKQYPYYWTGTTHLTGQGEKAYEYAAYIAFGYAEGVMNDELMDVHGAGAQRSNPKFGNADDYPTSFGPQGDIQMVYNYARCVRNAEVF